LLNDVGSAPGTTTVVTVPAAPVTGDMALIQNVQTLDSYIATLTALVQYKNHPAMYDLSDKQQATQFVIDVANARNYVVTGGVVNAMPMYLPMGAASTQTINKTTTSADLPTFIQAADAISQARWQEYYPTAASTIMFLNEPLLKELSFESGRNPGRPFDFDPYEVIPLAVTIQQHGQAAVARNVRGAHLAADANGNCVHFAGLIP
jgi:hypothetical protein